MSLVPLSTMPTVGLPEVEHTLEMPNATAKHSTLINAVDLGAVRMADHRQRISKIGEGKTSGNARFLLVLDHILGPPFPTTPHLCGCSMWVCSSSVSLAESYD